MKERRRNKRLPITLKLEVNELFKQQHQVVEVDHETIQVINISKTGIGITCKHELPLDYYFNAKIEFDDERFFFCVVKIIRTEKKEDRYFIGCEFVGLADFLAEKVDEYEEELTL